MSFYDNHDMPRLQASDSGFIDAHNWLFTARGIPVVYYGSETGFMRGRAEHAGNRAYFGQPRVDAAPQSPIFAPLQRIAKLREATPALQRGLQVNERLQGDEAVFFRVLQQGEVAQTALVLLNKGDQAGRSPWRVTSSPAAGAMHWTAVRCRWMPPWRPKCPHTA